MPTLPAALHAHLAQLLPEERLRAGLAEPRRPAIRVNTLRTTRAEALAALQGAGIGARPVEWLDDALAVEAGSVRAIQATAAFAAGHLHLQGLASIAVAHALEPRPGDRVLDACAAPGSKASHLAALMQNQGTLVAADASRARMFRLRGVLDHLGAVAQVQVERAERWGRRAPASFDRVLADAPCSAEGRALAGEEDAAADWSPRKCKRLASAQKAILHSAIEACAPGGTIVYSTCTMGVEENEGVLERALERYEGCVEMEEVPVHIPGAEPGFASWRGRPLQPDLAKARRVAPLPPAVHPDGPWLEGFFIARLRRLA